MWFQFHQRRGHYPIKHLTWRALQQYSTAFSHQLFLKTSLSYIFLLGFWLTFVFIIRIKLFTEAAAHRSSAEKFPTLRNLITRGHSYSCFRGTFTNFFQDSYFSEHFWSEYFSWHIHWKVNFFNYTYCSKKDNSWTIVIFSQD